MFRIPGLLKRVFSAKTLCRPIFQTFIPKVPYYMSIWRLNPTTHFDSCRCKTVVCRCKYKHYSQHHRHIFLRFDTDCCCTELCLQRAQTSLTKALKCIKQRIYFSRITRHDYKVNRNCTIISIHLETQTLLTFTVVAVKRLFAGATISIIHNIINTFSSVLTRIAAARKFACNVRKHH